jgi:dTDP-4-dehydrorhamnose reductase
MKKKILILGSNGMLGQELINTFEKDKDYKVLAWDRGDLDIMDEKQVNKKISKLKPDFIINAAAYNAVDKCETDKKEFELAKIINGKAPGYLAKVAKKVGAVFVHYSTDYVFGGENPEILLEPSGCTHACSSCALHKSFKPPIGYGENAEPTPISNYGKSKLMGEKEVQKVKGKYYLIRLSKLFGKSGKSEGAKKSFFDVMLGLGKNPPAGGVKVVDEETSCFTYAPDLAKKTKEIMESKKPFGIYHITNSGACTWYEAVLELYGQTKLKTKVIPITAKEYPRPAKRPYISTLINTKLNPLRSYKEALEEYLKGA